jgi:hypothetical protein
VNAGVMPMTNVRDVERLRIIVVVSLDRWRVAADHFAAISRTMI